MFPLKDQYGLLILPHFSYTSHLPKSKHLIVSTTLTQSTSSPPHIHPSKSLNFLSPIHLHPTQKHPIQSPSDETTSPLQKSTSTFLSFPIQTFYFLRYFHTLTPIPMISRYLVSQFMRQLGDLWGFYLMYIFSGVVFISWGSVESKVSFGSRTNFR